MAKHIARHHLDINIEKTLSQIVFSHVEQPTKSKFMLGRGNQEVSAYSREKSVSLELNPLLWWQVINTHIFLLCQYLLWGYQLLLYQVRVFSKAGDIDTTQMSSLRSIQVDLHIFLKKNIHGWLFDRHSSILVFSFRKTISYYLLGLLA